MTTPRPVGSGTVSQTANGSPPTVRRLPRMAMPRGARLYGMVGAALLLILLVMAVFAPVLAHNDPRRASGLPYEAPSLRHLLGTDDLGQDIWAELLWGTRISLTIGVLAALFSVTIGLTVALLAGYWRGIVETILMRIVDLTLALPFLALVIVLATFLGRGLGTTVIVIGAVIWARPARVLRSQVLKVREFQHVVAARAMGASTPYILVRHMLPRLTPLAVSQFVRAANVAVLIEASLAFLGLGDATRQSWGTMLFFANAHNVFLTQAWVWWVLPPGLALTGTVLGFALLGYAIEEWADPRLVGTGQAAPRRRVVEDVATAAPGATTISASSGVLTVRDFHVHYDTLIGKVRAVDGVSFTILPRRIVGLVGESGCGKSTLSMALLRLVRRPGHLVGGSVILNGHDLLQLAPTEIAKVRGRQIGLIPQSAMNALNPAYTVHHQVWEAAALTRDKHSAGTRAHELLEIVGIPRSRHGAYPHELSGGMRQRIVTAMAIANEPSLLVADEPLTGLDVVTQTQILRLLLDLRSQFGMSILLVSHDLPVVGRVADDLLVMYAGQIVESGTADQLLTNPGHPYTRALLKAFPRVQGPRQAILSIPGEPPDLVDPQPGCRFYPRCVEAFGACPILHQAPFEPEPGHRVACIVEAP
ncbi:MAG: dipeptide/oligopeptide/nickel ABC transporter permease/ATP-binding protein [Herpetosiphon sp.]